MRGAIFNALMRKSLCQHPGRNENVSSVRNKRLREFYRRNCIKIENPYRSNMRHKWPYLRTKMLSVLAKKHFSICTMFSEVQSTLSWNFWDRRWCHYLSFVRLNIHLSKVIKTFSQVQLLKCIRPLKLLLLNFGIFSMRKLKISSHT